MQKIDYGKYYHIYNRGTNSQKIFWNKDDYKHFFNLMSIFIEPVAEIYAYALMGNHIHFAVRVKEKEEIGYLQAKYAKSEDMFYKWQTTFELPQELKASPDKVRKPVPHNMFQHFFSTYAKGCNSKYKRTGALWEHPYKRILVENQGYLKRLILYIHRNPVKHGFCEHPLDYPWTSYLSIISLKPTKLSRKTVIGYFDNQANFKNLHNQEADFEDIKFLFMEE